MERRLGGEQHAMSTILRCSLQSLVHRRLSKFMEEGHGLLQLIWIMYSDEIVIFFLEQE